MGCIVVRAHFLANLGCYQIVWKPHELLVLLLPSTLIVRRVHWQHWPWQSLNKHCRSFRRTD